MNEKLVTVARFTDYAEADLARQLLEDQGINAFVMNQNVGITWGVWPPGGIELQTPESQSDEAKEILEASRQQKDKESEQETEEDVEQDWEREDE
jgi:hypothetical protein